MDILIEESRVPQPDLIVKNICIKISNLTFGQNASFMVQLFPEGIEYIDKPIIKYIDLTPDEYKQWGNDDNYIINLICQKLNLKLKV